MVLVRRNVWKAGKLALIAMIACLVGPGIALAGPFGATPATLEEDVEERLGDSELFVVPSGGSLFVLAAFAEGTIEVGGGVIEAGPVLRAAIERSVARGNAELVGAFGSGDNGETALVLDPREDNPWGSSYAVGTIVDERLGDDDVNPVGSSYAVGLIVEELLEPDDLDPVPLRLVADDGVVIELAADGQPDTIEIEGGVFEIP